MSKKKYEDDGRTIAKMNIEGMPWYYKDKSTNYDIADGFTAGEIRTMIFQMYRRILPAALAVAGMFFVVILLVTTFWF